ncbi:hypothetical protein Q7P37_000499 [Cladosporium fusiforme]
MPNSLESLPVEVRQKIFSLVLVERNPIDIDVYNARGQEIRLGVARSDHHRNPKHRGHIYVGRTQGWVPVVSSNAGLLGVSKQTQAEAAPLFYGDNSFVFSNANAPERFMKQIGGGMTGQLRHVSILGRSTSSINTHKSMHASIHRSLKPLVAAKDLRTLGVPHYYFCPSHYAPRQDKEMPLDYERAVELFVKHSLPLLQSLKASYEARNLTASVLDLVVVSSPASERVWCRNCRRYHVIRYNNCVCMNSKFTNGTIGTLLREEIITRLNLPRD